MTAKDELTAWGYRVLTQSSEGGVDSFVKNKKRSLFVHFQVIRNMTRRLC
jgi:hypothetical protein